MPAHGGLPFGQPITILRRVETGTDRYGNTIYDWPGPGITINGCAIAPVESIEPVEVGRTSVRTRLDVYAPPGTDIGPHDRLLVGGEVFEVTGQPAPWHNPYTGRSAGVVIRASRVTG